MSAITADAVEIVWVDHVGSDWIGIYVHGDKVYEGHPPDADDAIRLVLGSEYRDSATFPSASLSDKRRMRGLPQKRSTR